MNRYNFVSIQKLPEAIVWLIMKLPFSLFSLWSLLFRDRKIKYKQKHGRQTKFLCEFCLFFFRLVNNDQDTEGSHSSDIHIIRIRTTGPASHINRCPDVERRTVQWKKEKKDKRKDAIPEWKKRSMNRFGPRRLSLFLLSCECACVKMGGGKWYRYNSTTPHCWCRCSFCALLSWFQLLLFEWYLVLCTQTQEKNTLRSKTYRMCMDTQCRTLTLQYIHAAANTNKHSTENMLYDDILVESVGEAHSFWSATYEGTPLDSTKEANNRCAMSAIFLNFIFLFFYF